MSAPLLDIARMLKTGFAYQGEPSIHRQGARRGQSSGNLPPTAFISFLQNHDQIGNRAFGERLDALVRPALIEAALAVMLLSPMPPMLFMGEEWGETRPFTFFCDFHGALADAVRKGRRGEFEVTHGVYDQPPPDPLSEQTFLDSKIDWTKLSQAVSAQRRKLIRRLLECRTRYVMPLLANLGIWSADAAVDGSVLSARWRFDCGVLYCKANLGDHPALADPPPGKAIWNVMRDGTLPAWSVFWTWED